MQFAGGHTFTYSARPGTAAAQMPAQVPNAVRKERNARMRAALEESATHYRQAFIGQELPVLWESAPVPGDPVPEDANWYMHGLTDNYLRVYTRSTHQLWNHITPVLLTGLAGDGLYGTALQV
jgi:threonylcarbamoyladenosine tRNA methylthiotransferase MtaB